MSSPAHHDGPGGEPDRSPQVPRPSSPRRRRTRTPKRTVELVDDFFRREVTFVEDGVTKKRTALEVILTQLFDKATSGNSRAVNVLNQYRKFVASRGGAKNPFVAVQVSHEEQLRLLNEAARRRTNG